MHNYGDGGGSELAIPWNVLFGLGEGRVPANCSISMVASLCWDPEPDGVLGGDSAPSNVSAVLPTIDKVFTFVVDSNGDGWPDLPDRTPPTLVSAQSLGDTLVSVVFSERVTAATAEEITNYTAYETLVPGNGLTVIDASLQGDGKTVILKTGQQLPLSYTVLVSSVQDTSCYKNEIAPNSSVQFDGETTSVPGEPKPAVDRLHQNFPNPFNPVTTIELSLAGSSRVRLRIFDPQGRIVRTLADSDLGPGVWRFVWNGVSEDGRVCSSGIYFYSVESDRIRETKKMILLR
jgi:hypothetical protein